MTTLNVVRDEGLPDLPVRTSGSSAVYQRLPSYHIVWIEAGSGIYQVDFTNYSYDGERILFLEPGQYICVVAGTLTWRAIPVPALLLPQDPQLAAASRALFTHVYEVGAIAPSPGLPPMASLTEPSHLAAWIREAAQQWAAQKPLHPRITPREAGLLIDLRHLIETHYREQRSVRDYAQYLGFSTRWLNRVAVSRTDRTLSELVRNRQVLEAKRDLFFTDKPVQEIAYDLDFADPAYFSRFFSREVGISPTGFREKHAALRGSPFLEEVWRLIETHFRRTRSVAFYAEQLFLTPQALSAKVKRLTGQPFSRLIQHRVVAEARRLLTASDLPVQEIAWMLGFEEAPHFSRFYKRATGQSPMGVRQHT